MPVIIDAPSVAEGEALLARVKARLETDLADTELQAIIDEATAAIDDRYGPISPITVTLDGYRARLLLNRPIDTTRAVTIAEQSSAGATPATLAATDYTVRNGGQTLERVRGGVWYDDDYDSGVWARRVTVTYTPVDDSAQRQEVTIGLVQLAVDRPGLVKAFKAGDLSTTYGDGAAYGVERERLLASLAPRGAGMLLA